VASGQPDGSSRHQEAGAIRALRRAGCGEPELQLLTRAADRASTSGQDRGNGLCALAEFAHALGQPAARDYFRALRETGAAEELTGEPLRRFARSVDPHTAEWYFWAIWGTGAVRELTDERFLGSVDFFRGLDSSATVEYFLAIRETGEATALTSERVLSFLRAIGNEAAVEYLGAFWETRAVRQLTDPAVLDFASALGPDGAKEYFRLLRETKAVERLTAEDLRAFVRSLGARLTLDYLRALRTTRAVPELTAEAFRLFAELIGRGPARVYFRTLESTKAVGALTAPALFRASGVIRSIGADAALDFFLAVAASRKVPEVPGGREDVAARTVPVLTLLDLPAYSRFRPAGLAAASVAFWASTWGLGRYSIGPFGGLEGLLFVVGLWAALLAGMYVLLGAIAGRLSEQFLQRRRRLLNEHGIRWHDCLAGDRRCPLCWTPQNVHADRRYDYGRFCRCPAC
jgi:hypothetical protein